jgi:hypothetical protein
MSPRPFTIKGDASKETGNTLSDNSLSTLLPPSCLLRKYEGVSALTSSVHPLFSLHKEKVTIDT